MLWSGVSCAALVAHVSHEFNDLSCEQQLEMGQSILENGGVPHTQALPRILRGNGVNILQPGLGQRTVT